MLEVSMKRKGIVITLILIVLVAIIGGIALTKMKNTAVSPVTSTLTPMPTPTQGATVGTSDAALDTSANALDAKVKALQTDATSIDKALNDQQGNLSE